MSEDTERFERCISMLINTSVWDARVDLSHYTIKDIAIVREALKRARQGGRGKTLIKLLESKLKRLEKQAAQEIAHGA
jgi:hypothetical protein